MSTNARVMVCSEDDRNAIWDAMYIASGALLLEAKKDLAMYRMSERNPDESFRRTHMPIWRGWISKDMAKYRNIKRIMSKLNDYRRNMVLKADKLGRPIGRG